MASEGLTRVHVVMTCPHCSARSESDTTTIRVPDCAPPCPQSGCQSTADPAGRLRCILDLHHAGPHDTGFVPWSELETPPSLAR